MAHPYTAFAYNLPPEDVDTFLTNLLANPELYNCTFVSSGEFGAVFYINVDTSIENPFQTFYITNDGRVIITSNNMYLSMTGPHIHRFCCKIVDINSQDNAFSFKNECNKQIDMYAKTNENLNAVCLPLFFHSIVSDQTTDKLKPFVGAIYSKYSDKLKPSSMYGISFMPYSTNSLSLERPGLTARDILKSELVLSEIGKNIVTFNKTASEPVEINVIQIFKNSTNIYSFCVVLSLIIRLYFVGYCHGDLHLGNIIVHPYQSGMDNTTQWFFVPTFLLIDTGFAFKHSLDITLKQDNYEDFKTIINNLMKTPSPKSGETMMSWRAYFWFSKIFIDGVGGNTPVLNETRCNFIFRLFNYFERYRTNLETQRLSILETIEPRLLPNIRGQNTNFSASVDAYIASITEHSIVDKLRAYNSHGGHRRNYYVSNRKQTSRRQPKINKKHTRSVRRRKSQTRRRQRRHRSKSKHY